jgi:hypothetical protein
MGPLTVQTHGAELAGPSILRGFWPRVWACRNIRTVGASVKLAPAKAMHSGGEATASLMLGVNKKLASNIGLEEFWSLHTLGLVRPIPAEAG